MMEYATDQEILDECAEIGAWGLCTSIDLRRCDPKIIRDRDRLHQFIIEVCDLIEMKRFGEPQIIHTSVARRPPVLTGGGSASTPSNTFIIDANPYKGNA